MRTHNNRRAAAVGALVIAAGSGLIWAPPAQAAEQTLVRICKGTVDGEKVKLRAALHLRSDSDNDITAIDLRATDNSETGTFRNGDVNLRKLLLRVKDENGNLKARLQTAHSPLGIDLGSAGKEVGRVHAEARFRAGDGRGVVVCTFTFSDSDTEGGTGNS